MTAHLEKSVARRGVQGGLRTWTDRNRGCGGLSFTIVQKRLGARGTSFSSSSTTQLSGTAPQVVTSETASWRTNVACRLTDFQLDLLIASELERDMRKTGRSGGYLTKLASRDVVYFFLIDENTWWRRMAT